MDARLRALLPLFAAVFIDIFSFGLMYPVIVALFHDPIIESVYPPGLRNLYLSLAFSLFPLAGFFGASLLGDLSDAIGRRRTLLICMAGLAGAYLLMWLGVQTRELGWFLAGRLLSGLMAGTSPIAQAAMMDRSTAEERGRNLANVVLVNCVGLVAGPAIGGVLGHLDFRAPLLFALALCVLAFFWIARADIGERPVPARLELSWRKPVTVFLRAVHHPRIAPLALAFLLFQSGFAFYYIYIMINMENNYGFSALLLGLFSAMMGVGFVAGTTAGYRLGTRWLGDDRRLTMVALSACGLAILVTALPLPAALQWLFAFVVAVSNVPAFVALLAQISAAAGKDEQGWALGIGAALTGLSFFLAGLPAAILGVLPVWSLLALGGVVVLLGVLPLRGRAGVAAISPDPAG